MPFLRPPSPSPAPTSTPHFPPSCRPAPGTWDIHPMRMVLSWVDGTLEVGQLQRREAGGDPSSDSFSARIGGGEDITQPPHPASLLPQMLAARSLPGLAPCRCGWQGEGCPLPYPTLPTLFTPFSVFSKQICFSPLLPSSQDFSRFLPPRFSSNSILLPPVTQRTDICQASGQALLQIHPVPSLTASLGQPQPHLSPGVRGV